MRRTFIYIMILMIFVSCSKLSEQYGALALSVSSEVEVDVQTKSEQAGQFDSYNIHITGIHTGNDPYEASLVYGETDWPLTLPFGLYSITAESCTEDVAHSANEGFGCVRFMGMIEGVQVKTPVSTATDVSVVCTMANAKLSITFDDGFLSDFQNVRAEVVLGDRIVTITSDQASDVQAYFNVGQESVLTYTVYGTIDDVQMKYTSSIVLRPAKHARLTFKSNHNGILGPQVSVDKEIGTNEIEGAIDPESGTPVTGGDIESPVIYVDYEIKDAVEIETVIDVIDKEDMTL